MVRGQGHGSTIAAQRRRQHEGQDIALGNVVVREEEGDALVGCRLGGVWWRSRLCGRGDRVERWTASRGEEGGPSWEEAIGGGPGPSCMYGSKGQFCGGRWAIFLYGAPNIELSVRLYMYDIKPTCAQLTLVVSNITFTYK